MNKTIKMLFHADADRNLGLLILRVFLGASLLTHGWAKMFGGLAKHAQFVSSLGMPAPHVMAFLSAFAESFAALFLIVGFLTRPAALMVVVNMLVAICVVHLHDGFSKQEAAWLYLVPALFFVLKGAGYWSVDRTLSR
ncbi:MAG TPA: DoxX family protein [Kiritimatiellia bacterium]|jgi:putative oxidoreductase|nr:MAG: putative oxidoreductase MhqP [Verrucomicrobia bacterium ADurb.Bin018]HOE01054.1 DoxX family protein [Kiritimatiellia bacterium]HOE37723.1 DoxX family protein [Kiritimatiellia bacterium]HOR75101.1 DoxX family protein [Kiritimatiellia bacterium]HOU59737.1 DoxX family protein [Kiritimatiellia bacterium]